VADHTDRLALVEEGMYEADRFLAAAQVVGPHSAAGHDQTVVLISGDLGECLLHRERISGVDIAVHRLGVSGLDPYDVYPGARVLYGLLRLFELDLLAAHGGEEDGDLLAL